MNRPSSGNASTVSSPSCLPIRAGIGLKPIHFEEILRTQPSVGFFEVHAENYFHAGGPFHHNLERIREHYQLSVHGVSLSLGGTDRPDSTHLKRLKTLLDRYQPQVFSEHLAWTSHQGVFLNDLLPLPYTPDTLNRVCEHIDAVQTALKRKLNLENPATYVQFEQSNYSEEDFISEVVQRTGCGLLLDLSNVYVSCLNHGWDLHAYLSRLPLDLIEEIHLAGFERDDDSSGQSVLIDSHNAPIDQQVWKLYEMISADWGPRPTLIEWDSDLPSLSRWVEEAHFAEARWPWRSESE
ncbi:MAG: DUF692 domain-containing protein [Pseudomonadales bacterium]|nr:DUF692 domain-containing protein [Pseudomonadales bacterium]